MKASSDGKPAIITFKADASLVAALDGIENRSEFIRTAVLAALDNLCPLCRGSGILTPNQKSHWDAFASSHNVRRCGTCRELRLVCEHDPEPRIHPAARQ